MTKSRSIILGVLAAILFAIATLFCMGGTKSASADTYSSGKYKLEIDLQLVVNITTSRDYEVYLSGSTSGTTSSGTISSGAVLGFVPVQIEIVIPAGSSNSYHTCYGRVYDVSLSGPVSFSSSVVNNGSTSSSTTLTYTLSGLTDGTYTLSFTTDRYYYSSTIGGTSSSYTNEVTTTFIFVVQTNTDPCADGHIYKSTVVSATCTLGGYTTYTCSVCGDSYTGSTTQALGHSYSAVTTESSCTSGGYTTYTCTRCGASYSGNSTEPLGHSYVTQTVAATCEEGGYTLHTCSRCGNSYTGSVTQPLGHNYVTTTKAATCTEYGKTVYTCQVCGYEMSEYNGVYPTGHSYTVTLLSAATCTEAGERKYVCDSCGYEYTQTISATGHNYAITSTSSDDGVTTRVYTCTVCGDSYTQELGDQYEEVASFVEDLFEQYRPYMWWVLLATAGIWSIVMGVSFVIAQKNEDKEKAKKMIVNYFVGLVVIFAILVACPLLIRGIASLVT